MKCPYCRRSYGDIPNHIAKSKPCRERHEKLLMESLKLVLKTKEKNESSRR